MDTKKRIKKDKLNLNIIKTVSMHLELIMKSKSWKIIMTILITHKKNTVNFWVKIKYWEIHQDVKVINIVC